MYVCTCMYVGVDVYCLYDCLHINYIIIYSACRITMGGRKEGE